MSDFETALEHCASEPVHIPGTIQGHGAVIAVDNESLCLTHASANLQDVAGLDSRAVLGKNIYDIFPSGVRHDMVNNLLPPFLQQDTRMMETLELHGRRLTVGASAAETATIFEFESADEHAPISGDAVKQLTYATAQLHHVTDANTLFNKSVRLLQALTGYRRVMVYAFDGEGNGTIFAEALDGKMESFLGLNFPHWDIPPQARAIMQRTPFRYIGDVDGQPVQVFAASEETPPLDMTFSHLRGVPSIHMEYLRNMGTGATLTLNIVVQGQLWGIISLHHPAARVPEQNVREFCRNFARLFSLKLDTILQSGRLERMRQVENLRAELSAAAGVEPGETRFEAQLLRDLTKAMDADGAIIAKDGLTFTHGLVPHQEGHRNLSKWAETATDTFASSCLQQDRPDLAKSMGTDIAGVLLAPMSGRNFVAFFRRDRERETTWAGSPEKTIEGSGAQARLRPRGSFAAYKDVVRGTSEPWSQEQHAIARDVWSIMINSERKALIEKTTRQQKMLIDELNHRVRNILSLIRSLSRQSRTSSGSIDEYVTLLEDRIEAVANAHSLAVEEATSNVSIVDILRQEARGHNLAHDKVTIIGDNVGLVAESVPIFALVVHELMTNAAKYGALSNEAGHVEISLQSHEQGLTLIWTETGGPAVSPPQRKGFGSTLLENAVPKDLRGQLNISFAPEGLQAQIDLPPEVLRAVEVSVPTTEPKQQDPRREKGQTSLRNRLQCLLIEDNFVVSLDTASALNTLGFENVRTAMTSRDAATAIAEQKPDFAVLDVNLSGGDTSFGIAEQLLKLDVPFVFLTGYGVQGVPKDLFPNQPVLLKPLRGDDLDAILTEWSM